MGWPAHLGRVFSFCALSLVLLGLLSGCASSGQAQFSTAPLTTSDTAQNVDPRVTEDGLSLKGSVTLTGISGDSVQLASYRGSTCLAVSQVNPTADAQPCDFTAFIPASKLYNMPAPWDLTVFATDVADSEHFLQKESWTFNNYHGFQMVWTVKQYEDDVALASGEQGIRIHVGMRIHGYSGHTFDMYALIQDQDQHDFSQSQGGPIELNWARPNATYDDSEWDDLMVEIPYSRLSKLPPDQEIIITPQLREGANVYNGTVHISAWAGGTPDEVQAALAKQADDADRQIKSLQDQINQLNQGLKQ